MENLNAKAILKKGREKSVNNRHLWLFSGAVERIEGEHNPGDIIPIYSSTNEFLGKGFINENSQMRLRILTFKNEKIDKEFFHKRISKAINFRTSYIKNSSAYRLIHAEADLLSGLIVDRYNDSLVIQISSHGMFNIKSTILEILKELLNPTLIIERSDAEVIHEEGLESVRQVLFGDESNCKVEIIENGVKFYVDLMQGQKTGFFIDQRDNRKKVAELTKDKKMLNCFSYTGGFSVYSALEGATTTSIDISKNAMDTAKENFTLNNLDLDNHEFIVGDVFNYLREMGKNFDFIVLDPPSFVKHKEHVNKASRAYKDINRVAIKNIKNEGLILTCSCSKHIDWDLFQKIIFSAAIEANRNVQFIGRFSQPADHPVSVFQPESEYLKTFLIRICD